jgi:hypothetical protein
LLVIDTTGLGLTVKLNSLLGCALAFEDGNGESTHIRSESAARLSAFIKSTPEVSAQITQNAPLVEE